MLTRSFQPSSIEAALFFVTDHGKQNIICDWMSGNKIWQMCPKCHECCHNGRKRAASVTDGTENGDVLCPLSFPISPQPSTVTTMADSSEPNFVYRRRKQQGQSVTISSAQAPTSSKKSGEDSLSVMSCNTPSVAVKKQHMVSLCEHETAVVSSTIFSPPVCSRESHVLQLESTNGLPFTEDQGSDEASKNSTQKVIDVESINDSCSSSKSNVELVSASLKAEVEDTGECSSSGVRVSDVMGEDFPEKDTCISIFRTEGVLEGVQHSLTDASAEDNGHSNSSISSRLCKNCGHSDSALKMLICDNCEEAFHVACCNPRIKRIPIDEWFCQSCSKKGKTLKEAIARKSRNIIDGMSRCRISSSSDELNPVALMLRDAEPYTTGVRIGKGFQAEVPDWSGTINNNADTIGEPLEMDPSEFVSLHEMKSNKPSQLGSIGNWLQCRRVINGAGEVANATMCGKWRRAPLFEVQTDDWECFCSFLWDPIRADCAVPQELETDQVLKQVKYIQKLKPRLAAKRRKLEQTKRGNTLNSGEATKTETRQRAKSSMIFVEV